MSNEKFPTTRLYNRNTGRQPANDFISLEFSRFCKMKEIPQTDNISGYVKASLELVTGVVFEPNSGPIVRMDGAKSVNLYKSYQPNHVPVSDISLFKEYLSRLFPNENDKAMCIAWLAHLFQRPTERPSWHLMLCSEVGTGKGFLFESILNPLLANQTFLVNEYDRVIGKFASVLGSSMLVLLDDPKSKSDKTATQLKSILSEERAFIEPKGLTGTMVKTYTRFILASNERRPLMLDADERRWYVPARLAHEESKKETQEFIGRMAVALETPGYLEAIHNFFMNYNIDDFNHKHVTQSDALKEIIGLGVNSADYVFKDLIEDRKFFKQPDVLNAFDKENLTRPSDAHIKHALGELGYAKRQMRNEQGEKVWVWCNSYATQNDYRRHLASTPLF